MKINPDKIKEKNFNKSFEKLQKTLRNFDSENFESIGAICECIGIIDEFCARTSRKFQFQNENNLAKYRKNVYQKMVALVLFDETSAFEYTRKEIIKFIRGEYVHADSDIRDKKRKALHEFTFEENKKITLEYAVTWNFIIFPGIRFSDNTDSGIGFLQKVHIDDKEHTVTQIEAIALNAASEYIKVLCDQEIRFEKIAITNDLDAFSTRLGSNLIERLKHDWITHQKWQEAKTLMLS